ncbi:MAG: LapA family protein [Caldimonas sp.]
MRIIVWIVRAAIFFTLFAFALNNQHEAAIRWFFGQEWRAPMVFIVLAAFALGCAFGVFAMVPSWWRHRRLARTRSEAISTLEAPGLVVAAEPPLQHPPRDGL